MSMFLFFFCWGGGGVAKQIGCLRCLDWRNICSLVDPLRKKIGSSYLILSC
jgi:hypothetical protein